MHGTVHLLDRIFTDGGEEAIEDPPVLVLSRPPAKRVSQESEGGALMRIFPTILGTEHNPRLVRVELHPALAQPFSDPPTDVLRLLLAETMNNEVITVSLERHGRKLFGHPHIERVVKKEIRKQRRNC